jgi:hypothetical protein
MTPETRKFGKHPGASRAGRGALFLLSLSAELAYCFIPSTSCLLETAILFRYCRWSVLAAGRVHILGQHVRVLGQILEGNPRGGSSCAGSVRPFVDSTFW